MSITEISWRDDHLDCFDGGAALATIKEILMVATIARLSTIPAIRMVGTIVIWTTVAGAHEATRDPWEKHP